MKYEKYGIVGTEREDILTFTVIGLDSIYVQYNNGDTKKISLDGVANANLEVTRFLRSAFPKLKDNEIIEAQKEGLWHAYTADSQQAKDLESEFISKEELDDTKQSYEEQVAETKKYKAKKAATTASAIALAALLGAAAGSKLGVFDGLKTKLSDLFNTKGNTNNELTLEDGTTVVNKNNLVLDAANWEELNDLLRSGSINQRQMITLMKIVDFIEKNNVSESWETVELTDEEVKEINEILKEMKYQEIEGNKARFGFTPTELEALSLRFGDLTKEEITSIVGGNEIDVNATMDESNSAIKKLIIYLTATDTYDMDVTELVEFNGKGTEAIKEINDMFKEYKSLVKEAKKDKAEEKMTEIRNWLINFSNSTDNELNSAKSYILRTYLVAGNILSEANGYKIDEELTVLNSKTDKNETIKVKMDLFDDLTMRNLVLGFDNTFNKEEFMKQNNIDSKYVLVSVSDVKRSVADEFCSEEELKLHAANVYMDQIKENDQDLEIGYAVQSNIDLSKAGIEEFDNVKTKYDEYTDRTVNLNDFSRIYTDQLVKDGKAPLNSQYFETLGLASMVHDLEVISNPALGGKKGDIISTREQAQAIIGNGAQILDEAGLSQEREAAEKAAAAKIGAYDGNSEADLAKAKEEATKLAQARAAVLQGVYDATYNHFYGSNVINTSYSYDASWEHSSDADVRSAWARGKAGAEREKAVDSQVGKESGGGVTYHDIGDGKTYPSEDNNSNGSTTTETTTEIVNENTPAEQEEIDKNMAGVEGNEYQPTQPENNENNNQNENTQTLEEGLAEAGVDSGDIDWLEGFGGDIEIEGPIVLKP